MFYTHGFYYKFVKSFNNYMSTIPVGYIHELSIENKKLIYLTLLSYKVKLLDSFVWCNVSNVQ